MNTNTTPEYAYGYRVINGIPAKCAHMNSILDEQVQALISAMSQYERDMARSNPRAIHTVYHMVLERAQENRVSILRATLINERALAIEFALAIMTS